MPIIKDKIYYDENNKSKLLGKSKRAAVYVGQYQYEVCAIKIVQLSEKDKQIEQKYLESLKENKNLKHKNLLELQDIIIDGNIFLVLDYCKFGLEKMIEDQKSQLVQSDKNFNSESQALIVIFQIAQGLMFLHQRKIIYGQLRPSNVLNKDGVIKLAELGISRLKKSKFNLYRSPEQLIQKSQELEYNSDLWSLGVMFYEMIYGCLPFQGNNLNKYQKEIQSQIKFPPFPQIRDQTKDLIRRLLQVNEQKRISLNDFLNQLNQIPNTQDLNIYRPQTFYYQNIYQDNKIQEEEGIDQQFFQSTENFNPQKNFNKQSKLKLYLPDSIEKTKAITQGNEFSQNLQYSEKKKLKLDYNFKVQLTGWFSE